MYRSEGQNMIEYDYDPKKATQTACQLVKLAGGKINYTDLIKLLYLADREALDCWGKTITTDRVVVMDQGMVMSHIFNHIKDDAAEREQREYWSRFISDKKGYCVRLLVNDPPYDELSKREIDLLVKIFNEHGHKGRRLNTFHHALPEWEDPHGSSVPIHFEKILEALGKNDEEIEHIDKEATFVKERARILQQR